MQVVRLTLCRTARGPHSADAEAKRVRDAIWAQADSRLDHISIIPMRYGLHVALFLKEESVDGQGAIQHAISLLRPICQDWRPATAAFGLSIGPYFLVPTAAPMANTAKARETTSLQPRKRRRPPSRRGA